MKDFILRNSERVFALLLTGIFLALLYFGLIAIIWILTDRFLLFVLTKMGYYSEDWSKVVGVIIGKRIAKAPRTRANHFLVVKVGDTKRNFFVSQSNFNILEKGDSLWLRKVRVHYKGRVVRTFYELADRY